MGRKPKFSSEIKIEACENYKMGKGSYKAIAKTIGCNESVLRRWYSSYINIGPSAFDYTKRNCSYSMEFKVSIVKSYLSGEYSTIELCGKYNLSHSMVNRWINKYNSGIELQNYDPKGGVYTMKSRKTTFEERIEIVKWVIENDMSYKEAASNFAITYALVYKWTKAYLAYGSDALKYKTRGRKTKSKINERPLSEVEKLKLELERERTLRKRKEFELEVLKKKEEFEKKNRYQK